jgi:hypothetical protein
MPTPEERRATARYLQQMRQLGLIGEPEPITADSPIALSREAQSPRPTPPQMPPMTLEPPDELEHVSPLEYERAPGTFPLSNEAEEALVTRDGLAQEPFGDIAEASRPIQASDERRRGRAARRERIAQAREQEQAKQDALAERRQTLGEVGPVTQFARALGQDASLGHLDEIMGGARAVGDVITGDSPITELPERYRQRKDEYNQWLAYGEEDQPVANALGHVGALAAGAVSPAGPIARWTQAAPSALGRIGRTAAVGTGVGGVAGSGFSDAPFVSGEHVADTAGGALLGGAIAGGLGAAGEGARILRDRYGRGRAFAESQRELGERSRRILEGDEDLPDFAGSAIDDLEFDELIRASADDVPSTIPTTTQAAAGAPDEATTLRSLITEPLNADRHVQRIRSAGIQTIPAGRAISRMKGGLESFADDLDRGGVTQVGELVQTPTGVRRGEQLRDKALRQRQRAIARANEVGAGADASTVAARLRERAGPVRASTSNQSRANAAYLEGIADEIEALPVRASLGDELASAQSGPYAEALRNVQAAADQGESAIRGVQRAINEALDAGDGETASRLAAFLNQTRRRPLPQDVIEREIQAYTDRARFDRNTGQAVLSPEIQMARAIRGEIADARLRGLQEVDPQLARQFANAQRGYQIGATISPPGQASRAQLGEFNRALSLSDYESAIAGSAAAGPAGGIAGLAANRLFRRVEPSVFALINERAVLMQRAAQGQLSPAAARMVALLERDPEAVGQAGRAILSATTRGPRSIEAVYRVLVGRDPAMRAAAQELEDATTNEWDGVIDGANDETTNEWEGIQ